MSQQHKNNYVYFFCLFSCAIKSMPSNSSIHGILVKLSLAIYKEGLPEQKRYLQIVSTSIPENPKALSPSMQTTRFSGVWSLATIAAAIAKPSPTPIVPKVPASSLNGRIQNYYPFISMQTFKLIHDDLSLLLIIWYILFKYCFINDWYKETPDVQNIRFKHLIRLQMF